MSRNHSTSRQLAITQKQLQAAREQLTAIHQGLNKTLELMARAHQALTESSALLLQFARFSQNVQNKQITRDPRLDRPGAREGVEAAGAVPGVVWRPSDIFPTWT